MTSNSSVRLEEKGYNRGLILGLTMAESMLLLVFCLLLVAGAVIAGEKVKADRAKERADISESELRKERDRAREAQRDLNDRLALAEARAGADPAQAEKREMEWRELVRARGIVEELGRKGVKEDDIARLAGAADALLKAGVDVSDAQKVAADLRELASSRAEVKAFKNAMEELVRANATLETVNKELVASKAKLESENKTYREAAANAGAHQWPPIISLSEAEGYSFEVGSAELTSKFRGELDGRYADEIFKSLELYDADIVEVIGHTDEQPITRTGSNLDKTISDVMASRKPVSDLVPSDNAGLGLARAVSVANVLRSNPKVAKATVIPLSAAQLVLPGDVLTKGQGGDVKERRRIEIRIRRRLPMTDRQKSVSP